jgi:hypothetical protein
MWDAPRDRRFEVMTTTAPHLKKIAGAALCAAALLPATASAKTQTLRYFDKPTDIVQTQADGTVVDHAPYPDAGPGDTLDVFSLDYVGNHKKHAKKATASSHLHCVFAAGPPTCTSDVAIGGALLFFKGDAIAFGTGVFRGASGTAVNKMVSDADNTSDVTVKVKLR